MFDFIRILACWTFVTRSSGGCCIRIADQLTKTARLLYAALRLTVLNCILICIYKASTTRAVVGTRVIGDVFANCTFWVKHTLIFSMGHIRSESIRWARLTVPSLAWPHIWSDSFAWTTHRLNNASLHRMVCFVHVSVFWALQTLSSNHQGVRSDVLTFAARWLSFARSLSVD